MHTVDPSLLLLQDDVGACYEAVARTVAASLGAEACSIALYDAETDELIARRPRYAGPSETIPQFRFPLEVAPASERVVRSGQAYLSNAPASDPLYDISVRENGVRAILTAPVRHEGRILGLLYALNKPGGFTAEDVQQAQQLADTVGVTLENIQRFSGERSRRLLNEALREASRALVGTASEPAALGTLLDQMWRVVRYQSAAALAVDGDDLRVGAARGMSPVPRLALADCPELARMLEMRTVCRIPQPALRLARLGLPAPTASCLAVPLVARGQVLGALLAAFAREPAPADDAPELVAAFAEHAALFLEAGAVLRRERESQARAAAAARIARTALRRLNADALLRAAAPDFVALSRADRAVCCTRAGRGTLAPVAEHGFPADETAALRERRLPVEEPPLSGLLAGRVVVVEPGGPAAPSLLVPMAETVVALPLDGRDGLSGAVLLGWTAAPRRLDRALLEQLADAAGALALGLENARLAERVELVSAVDELTQLGSRRRFLDALKAEVARARRKGDPFALVRAELDHLGRINESLGPEAGDLALRHVADALRRGTRAADVAARLGDGEFGLLLPATDLPGALVKAERIRAAIAGQEVAGVGRVTISCGVAGWAADGRSEQELMLAAGRRMAAARASGRDRVCFTSAED